MSFEVRVVKRTGALCVIERTNSRTGSVHWEVWRMQLHSARVTRTGENLPAGEYPPSTSEWGTHGWTFLRLTDALQACRSLGSKPGVKRGVLEPVKGRVAPPL